MKVRTIIVDDEDLARQMIKEYLRAHPMVEVVAECSGGEEAVRRVNAMRPDLLFLDIQMPGLTGFEVLEKLDHPPFIIFSTAYDRYALRAFEINAIDYLLKPFDKERFDRALSRAFERMQNKTAASQQILSLLNNLQTAGTDPQRFWIKEKGCLKPIKHEAIDWIEAMDDYACLHVGQTKHLVNQTMRELEARLDEKMFMRIHRSAIVNLDRIKELRPIGDGSYQVILKNNTQLSLSRSQAKKLKELVI